LWLCVLFFLVFMNTSDTLLFEYQFFSLRRQKVSIVLPILLNGVSAVVFFPLIFFFTPFFPGKMRETSREGEVVQFVPV